MFGALARMTAVTGTVLLLALMVSADSLQLRNGSIIKGKYLGGTDSEISFQVGSTAQKYAVSDVVEITFEVANTTAAPSAGPQLMPREQRRDSSADRTVAMPAASSTVTLPVGTRILVRTIDTIDSDRNQVGDKFQASVEQPVVINDAVVIPKGADIYGRLTAAAEAGHIQGRSQLKLELTGVVVNGQTLPLVTGDYSVSGSSRGATTAKRVGGGAALGAVIGAVAGGGKGAAIGAGVGAGAGTAVQVMTKGEQVHVPSETLLEFSLQQEARVPMSNSATPRR